MSGTPIVLLSGGDLRRLLRPETTIAALRETYATLADSRGDQGRSVAFTVEGGSIHVKSGVLPGSHLAFASKVNVNLPENAKLRGLPTIQGIVVVSDAKDGRPLAVMDSIALTGIRTAATAALAAQYGARRDSTRAAIIGCGAQAGYQLEALRSVFALRTVRVFDIDTARAEAFAAAHSTSDCTVTPAPSVPRSGRRGGHLHHLYDVKVARPDRRLGSQWLLRRRRWSRQSGEARDCPGLMRRARILVDDLEACASGGDLNHALRSGAVSKDRVHADLAELASGRKQGRLTADELVIFDSSGSGVQDVAAAWAAYQEADRLGVGLRFDLSGEAK